MSISKFLLVFYFLPFVIFTTESNGSGDDANPSIYQLRARSQPRSGGRFTGQSNVVEPDKEALMIRYLTEIRQRCLERNQRGRRKYPRAFNVPKDEEEERQNNDTRYLNKFSELVESSGLSKDSEAVGLFHEIMGWKPEDEEKQMEKVEAYVQRLQEIKQRGLDREKMGLNKYPLRDSRDSTTQENKDSMFLHRRPPHREAIGLWEEIRAWKPLLAPQRKDQSAKRKHVGNLKRGEASSSSRDLSPEQNPAQHGMGNSVSKQLEPSQPHGINQQQERRYRGMGPPDEIFQKAWFDVSLKPPPEEPKERVAISSPSFFFKNLWIYFGLCLLFIFIHNLFTHQHRTSNGNFYEEF